MRGGRKGCEAGRTAAIMQLGFGPGMIRVSDAFGAGVVRRHAVTRAIMIGMIPGMTGMRRAGNVGDIEHAVRDGARAVHGHGQRGGEQAERIGQRHGERHASSQFPDQPLEHDILLLPARSRHRDRFNVAEEIFVVNLMAGRILGALRNPQQG